MGAIRRVRFECDKVASMCIFSTTFTKCMRLEEFQLLQSQSADTVTGYLKNNWVPATHKAIVGALSNYGKGWFNLHEKNQDVYEGSKLRKFMKMVRLLMEDSIRSSVLHSITALVNLIAGASKFIMEAPSLEWPGEDLFSEVFRPPTSPLLVLDLVINPATGTFTFSTPVGPFEQAILAVFDAAILCTKGVLDLEPLIMSHLFWVGKPVLNIVDANEKFVLECREKVRACICAGIVPLQSFAAKFNRYSDLLKLDIKKYLVAFQEQDVEAGTIKKECERHLKERAQIERDIPLSVSIGLFYVTCDQVRQHLGDKHKKIAENLLDILSKNLRKQADEVCARYAEITSQLHSKPNGIEEATDQRAYMETIPDTMTQLQVKMDRAIREWDMLAEFKVALSDDDANVRWTTFGWPKKLQAVLVTTGENLDTDETRFHDNLVKDLADFDDRIVSLQIVVAGFSSNVDIKRVESVAAAVRQINKQLKESQADAVIYNNRQRLFGMPVTEYDKLNRAVRDFEPYKLMWLTMDDWQKAYKVWMNDSFMAIDPEALEASISNSYKAILKAGKAFKESESLVKVANEVKGWIEAFQPFVPLIQALRNPGMRERHWEALSEKIGFSVMPDESFTFQKCLDMKLPDRIDLITKIGEVAGKEFAIEQALNKMEGEWKTVNLEIIAYKNTGTYIMRSADEVSQLLDDHIVMTQAMSFSPFKKPFEGRIATWESKLQITQDVLEEWLTCQKSWLYLEPIFSSDDIARQLPTESKRYQTMDKMWRKALEGAFKQPNVITYCPNITLLESFKESNKLLDQVQKGLSAYLETKRGVFPRFYFLSDDELLEILSQTKDPQAVQPHMRKCFDNIAKLRFQEDMRMSHFVSADGEEVAFCEDLYPTGNVEEWLLEVERVMRVSLRKVFEMSLLDYVKKPRADWVLAWPGQVVIGGGQTVWTAEVTEAIEQGVTGLPKYLIKMTAQLTELVRLVRGDLNPIAREVLSALIVIEVHARDVVDKMILQNVMRSSDFEWISQLRYYWGEDDKGVTDLRLKAVNATFDYGFEYLGNSGRLVITPLTDRCYLTLTGALALIFGGAPAGPAGTGKTETTKDLAKAMAIQCVVFNCSDQLDFMAMGKFFKGLATAGAWACFDEFNRIDIEVLSVVAQQVSTIQQAIKGKEKRFMFEGCELVLRPTAAPFITMNPGYAGRTELPDNLAALFRPVAMMVPDYTMIAEISLYSFGFEEAKALSKKITTVFKLASEQLSSQDHYDFGMRAVKTVISAAGNLKRAFQDMPEDEIVLRAIKDVNVPKFLVDDLKLFNGIVSDLFPYTKMKEMDYGPFEEAIKTSCSTLQLQPVPGYVTKVIQLYETTVVRHGLMLVGPTGSGKTQCYKVLQNALTSLAGEKATDGSLYSKVNTFCLNPKSITMGQLYGQFDPMTHEWTDGILSTLVRAGVSSQDLEKKWYVFDGPVDAIWIENMNTVLDDNKKLCLASGEIIALTREMRMIFEVEDLTVASPATVSRCGMVYLEPSILGTAPFVTSWLDKSLPPLIMPFRAQLQGYFDHFLDDGLRLLRREMKEMVMTVDSNITFSLFRLLDCFFSSYYEKEGRVIASFRVEALPKLIEPWFMFSLVWSMGATSYADGRVKFDSWIRRKMAEMKCALQFPITNGDLVYTYKLIDDGIAPLTDNEEDLDTNKKLVFGWKNFMSGLPEYNIDVTAPYASIIVPTIDTVRTSYILELLLTNDKQVLCVGPTGTAKTLTITDKLLRYMDAKFQSNTFSFSAQTSANQTQDMIDMKLDKRRKGIFGPPLGKKIIMFIDDLNMPALETYGAQPPIEILRQFMDHKGWYDRKMIGTFKTLVDITFCCAMGPPGGGRNPVTKRFTRHFNFISLTELEDISKRAIFRPILLSFMNNFPNGPALVSLIVDSTIQVYNTISAELLPTPAKVHYTFNLRDLSKVFQGILMVDITKLQQPHEVVRLWVHECRRIFKDRLINVEDRAWFEKLIKDKIDKVFKMQWDEVVPKEPLLYGDFMDHHSDVPKYSEVLDLRKAKVVMDESLEDYNAQVRVTLCFSP